MLWWLAWSNVFKSAIFRVADQADFHSNAHPGPAAAWAGQRRAADHQDRPCHRDVGAVPGPSESDIHDDPLHPRPGPIKWRAGPLAVTIESRLFTLPAATVRCMLHKSLCTYHSAIICADTQASSGLRVPGYVKQTYNLRVQGRAAPWSPISPCWEFLVITSRGLAQFPAAAIVLSTTQAVPTVTGSHCPWRLH